MKQLIAASAMFTLGITSVAADDCNTKLAGPDNRRPTWAGEGPFPGSLDLARGMDREAFEKAHSEEVYGNFLVGHSWKYYSRVLTFRENEIEARLADSNADKVARVGEENLGIFPVSEYKIRMLPTERRAQKRLFIEPIYKGRVPASYDNEERDIKRWASQGFILRSPFRGGDMVPARVLKNQTGQEWLRITSEPHESFSRVIGFYDLGNVVLGKWDSENAIYEFSCDTLLFTPKGSERDAVSVSIAGYETVLSGPNPLEESATRKGIDRQFYFTRIIFDEPLADLRKRHPELANWTGDFRLMYQSLEPRDRRAYDDGPQQPVLVSQIPDDQAVKLAWMLEHGILDEQQHKGISETHADHQVDPNFDEYDRYLIDHKAVYPDYPHFEPVLLSGPKPVGKRKTIPWEK